MMDSLEDILEGDCPKMGVGLGHAWVQNPDGSSGCSACGINIPDSTPEGPMPRSLVL